jgi:NitT/TauT family transport system ATP-binding protein
MKSLTIEHLQKTYFDPFAAKQVTAIRDISLAVDAGDFVSVVGPSGCGKTTLLNTIAGFLAPTAGTIRVDGSAVKGPGPDRGVVFQSFALFPWRTVLDNVAFGPKMRGVPKARRHDIAREYLALAGLSHAAEQYPNELSGGMQQRVGVVRALANELTRIWAQRRSTVLFITHDVNEAVFLANRVIVLSHGAVLDDIPIDLPRPRSWDALIEDAGFKALSARVLQQVRAA